MITVLLYNGRIISGREGPGVLGRETAMPSDESDKLLTPAETAAKFRVDPKTVTRWARAGKITAIRTLGGHRRYKASEVEALMGRPEPEPDPLGTPVRSLWGAVPSGPAALARKRLTAAGIDTVGDLITLDAGALAAIGIRDEALSAVRLALYKRGLALHGEVIDKVA
jgi:excisionase family DNA binding protein